MKMLVFHLLVFFVLIFSFKIYGQSNCAQTLHHARAIYDQGKLHELPNLLEGCLHRGFSQQEKVEAYKLLTLAYIYLEEPSQADETLLKLLQADPYFTLHEDSDPAEFISLYHTFRTWPIYRFGARIGANGSSPTVVSHISAIDGQVAAYNPSINFQAGFGLEIPLRDKQRSERFTLNPELHFNLKSYYYDSDLDLVGDIENSSEGTETQQVISLPISMQIKMLSGKVNPYLSAGFSTDMIINAELVMQRNRTNANAIQERTFDITHSRKRINFSVLAATGIKIPLGGGYVVTELQFSAGLFPINSKKTAFTIDDHLVFDNGYADNIMRVNSVSLTAGYIYNIFKPKKLKIKK